MKRTASVCLIVAAFGASISFAPVFNLSTVHAARQARTGQLTGIVRDATGAVISGATITATNEATKAVETTTSDASGKFAFAKLLPGTYTLEITLSGFQTTRVTGISVKSGAPSSAEIELQAASVSDVVEVSASGAAIVNSSSASLTVSPSTKQIQELPINGRRYQSLVLLSPGATAGNGANLPQSKPSNTESYAKVDDNPFKGVAANPLSTFSVDVDTASYSNVRRFLTEGTRPPKDAVRIEEMVNYFGYDYPDPTDGRPFSVNVEVGDCPWKKEHRLVRVGLKGKEIRAEQRPACNLVFLIDVSGSMSDENKLPLVKSGLKLLAGQLTEKDRVAIVVYAGSSGLVLPSTPGNQREAILDALDRLSAGGSTNGAEGIELAYQVAQENFIKEGANRVILCTDGDFNVGVTDQGSLTRLIEEKAKKDVFLSVLGFGTGNYKDSTMEALADKGNGNYAYIDTFGEARKALGEQMSGTLVTIAKDVKIQVEFNPAKVQAYRLIGYENRILAAEDFEDDKKDAGEIGAGHRVTALYEVVPVGVAFKLPGVPKLKYSKPTREKKTAAASGELLTVSLRYKEPTGTESTLMAVPVTDDGRTLAATSTDFRFAASVAAFGMLLRESEYRGNVSFSSVLQMATAAKGDDRNGYRAEFLELVKKASDLPREESAKGDTGQH
jgi:Ca-activated chloride channel family protein